MSDFLEGVLAYAMVLAILLVVLLGPPAIASYISCKGAASVMEVQYRWTATGGCFYRINDAWVPSDAYRVLE